MVNKYILILTINFNKAKTFVLVEPLYFSFWHSLIPPLEVFLKLGYDLPKKKHLRIHSPMPRPVELFTNFDRHPHLTGSMADLLEDIINALLG